MILTAFIVMIAATLAQHLGLTEAVMQVADRIAECPMCFSFWACLLLLITRGCDPVTAAGLSLLMAYLSNWFGLLLIWLQKAYTLSWNFSKGKSGRYLRKESKRQSANRQ